MKTIGIIGGNGWEISGEYYRLINEFANRKLGGKRSCSCLLYSMDPDVLLRPARSGDGIGSVFAEAVRHTEEAGADFNIIISGALQEVADAAKRQAAKPVLLAADATAEVLRGYGIKTAGLLMALCPADRDYYTRRMKEYGIKMLLPSASERCFLDRLVGKELRNGNYRRDSAERLAGVINALEAQGAEGIILGDPELALMIHQADTAVPLFDQVRIHAEAAAAYALAD